MFYISNKLLELSQIKRVSYLLSCIMSLYYRSFMILFSPLSRLVIQPIQMLSLKILGILGLLKYFRMIQELSNFMHEMVI